MTEHGWARSPLRAVVVNPNASVASQRRAEDCPAYHPRFDYAST